MDSHYQGSVNLLGQDSVFGDGQPLTITDSLTLTSVPANNLVATNSNNAFIGVAYGTANSAYSVVQRDTNGNINMSKANCSSLTPNTVLVSDSSNNVVSSSISTNKLGYMSNVTSDLQTQLNTLTTNVGTNTTTLAGLNSLSVTVGNNATSIDTLNTEMTSVNGNIAGLHSSVVTNTSDIATNTTNIATNTASINTINTELATLQPALSGLSTNSFVVADSSSSIGTTTAMELNSGIIQVNQPIQTASGIGASFLGDVVIAPYSAGNALSVCNTTGSPVLSVATTGTTTASGINISSLTPSTVLVSDSSNDIVSSGVSSTTLGYLDATSSIQTQLNNKQAIIALNPNIVAVTNGSGVLTSSSVSTTKLGYLANVTSDIQTQINTLNGDLTLGNNAVVVTNGAGNLSTSSVSSSTLGYLDATSSVQTQLNGKQGSLSGLTSGDYIIATGSGSVGNGSILSESGNTLTAKGRFTIDGSSTSNTLHRFQVINQEGQLFDIYDSSSSLCPVTTMNSQVNILPGSGYTGSYNPILNVTGNTSISGIINNANLTASTVLVSDASQNIISASGYTSGHHMKATSTGAIGTSSILSESGTTLTMAGTLLPSATTTYNLGSTSAVFNNIYGSNIWASTNGYSSYGGYVLLGYNNGGTAQNTITAGSVQPLTNNVGSLGSSSNKWSNLWTYSTAYIGGDIGWSGQSTFNTNVTLQGPNSSLNGALCYAWSTYSSSKYKEDINDLDGGLDTIMKLRPVSYKWKKGQGDNLPNNDPLIHTGFIAQEVQKVYPQCVSLDENDDGGMDYTKLIVFAIKAIQEQQQMIIALQKDIATLKA